MFSMDLPLSWVGSKIDSIKVQSINLGFGIHGAPDPENSIIAENQRIKSWKKLNLNFTRNVNTQWCGYYFRSRSRYENSICKSYVHKETISINTGENNSVKLPK